MRCVTGVGPLCLWPVWFPRTCGRPLQVAAWGGEERSNGRAEESQAVLRLRMWL
jgi:hypothetical protein